jgi:hypothetical protein
MWCKNPDPVDFRRLGLVNIYEDANAYEVRPGRERPVRRQVSGQPTLTIREEVREDLLYGSRGRSGRQLEAYHALFGSVGADGYPKPLWDAETGVIDTAVIAHWRKYDLLQYLKENWSRIGPDIVGKLHFSRGDMDNYYFNEALYGVEGFLESRSDPYYAGEFVWGRPRKGHGWIPERWKDDKLYRFIANYITRVAPPSADTKSWKY